MSYPSSRITAIAGHYGSGKTEFAVNLACSLAASQQKSVTLVDLDIVNPYFCSREREESLAAAGVSLIAPSKSCHHADVPALPAEVARIFVQGEGCAILDVGGEDNGARVLARYRPQLSASSFDFWMVLNANRPQTAAVEPAFALLQKIEQASGQKITGIVNNTHLCQMTTPEEVIKGYALACEVAERATLPVICSVATAEVFAALKGRAVGERFPIEICMKKPWE